ncbi:MAG: alpha glucosidase [Verrucomicrobia bacterium]|nr:alpha glucosidase [Verrucomicrobiota bacterium]
MPNPGSASAPHEWWRGAVIYEIYVRSFADSDGDGVGDLDGITGRLGYVRDLGADAVWLTPFFKSPMADFGYDVEDYTDVDPQFGTLADFDALAAEAGRLGLKVVIDLVLSHTSERHPWFRESRQDWHNPKADWYVWADPKPDGTPPNNWLSAFGGPAWQWDPRRRQYYLHNFLKEQPDLNLHQPAVQDALLEVARFWLNRGVTGLRLDAANFYMHDCLLRDNPPWPKERPYAGEGRDDNPYYWQRHLYDKSQPENLTFLRRMRQLLDRYPGAMAVAEVADDEPVVRTAEYVQAGVLHTAYNFSFLGKAFDAGAVRTVFDEFEATAPGGWPSWAFSNHDSMRLVSRWLQPVDQTGLAKMLVTLLVSVRGTAFLYQGEELGLPEADVPFERLRDPYGIAFWPDYRGRDGCRTPMPWTGEGLAAGFSQVEPWLPVPEEHRRLSVAAQAGDPGSVLNHVKALLAWRRHRPALVAGDLQFQPGNGPVLAFRRTSGNHPSVWCAFNFSGREGTCEWHSCALSQFGVRANRRAGGVSLGPYGFVLLEEEENAG